MSAAAASPVKKAKKASKPKVPAAHPPYASMVPSAVGALKERGGSSKIAIVKYIMANYKVGDDKVKVGRGVKTALKGGVTKGTLKQVKGTGATGSFRLGEKPKAKVAKKPKAAAKKVKKPKKAAATKPKKAAAAKKAKSPKKEKAAKKPAAKKAVKPKKVKTPKKAAAKKPVAKKPAAKKTAKKAAKK